MSLSNLAFSVLLDVGSVVTNMDLAAKVSEAQMGAATGSVEGFRQSVAGTSTDMQAYAASMGTNMTAANDAVQASSTQSVAAIENIGVAAGEVEFKSMGEKISESVGVGIGVGIIGAQKAWEGFVLWTKTKALVTGLAVAAIFTAVGLGAVYSAYKVISGTWDFAVGLLTGDSYKSASIDEVIAMNNEVKALQENLHLTAQQASATNAALASMGVNKADYSAVFEAAATAVRGDTDELDRLGVAYKDAQKNILPLDQVISNANKVLGEYTEGWDRNHAAASLGLGSAAAVAGAASVTSQAIAEAGARLDDYNLGIGEETQAAVKRYEDAMRAFNRETELTSSGFHRAWSDQIMPILTDFAEFFKDGFPFAVNTFRYSMAVVTSLFYGLKTVVQFSLDSVVANIGAVGIGLASITAAGVMAMQGNFAGAKATLSSGWDDIKQRFSDTGDKMVEQARKNSAAMALAWAMDDRSMSNAAPKPKKGKEWKAAPDKDDDDDEVVAAVPLDDVAKKVMEGALRTQEDFIADEKTLLQTRQEFLRSYYNADDMSTKEYYSSKQKLIADGLAATLDAYDKEIKAVEKYIEIHKTESDKQADIVGAQNKIAEIRRKRAQEESQVNRELALSYLDLSAERMNVSQSLMKADEQENKAFEHRIGVLTAFRDAQLENAKEGNRLIEEETLRHNEAVKSMQYSNDQQALSQAQGLGDQMLTVLKDGGREQTALYKALFLANKAIAVAEILINTEVGAAKALGFGPFGIPMASIIRGLGYASAGLVAGTAIAGAFADGGDPPVGKVSLVGERGPELFVPKTAGTIIPNHLLGGGGGGEKITIVNQTTGRIDRVVEQRISPNERALIIQETMEATAASLTDPSSRLSKSMGSNFNLQRPR